MSLNVNSDVKISQSSEPCQICYELSWVDYRDYVFNEAIQKDDLKPIESLLLLYLLKCADENGRCYPSLKTLSRKLNVNRKTIQRALKTLEKSGLIKKGIMELGNRKVKLAFQLLRDGMPVAFMTLDRGQKVPGIGVKKCLGTKPYELSQFKEESAKGSEILFKSAGYGAEDNRAKVAELVAGLADCLSVNPGNGGNGDLRKEVIRERFNRPIVKPLTIRERDLIKPSDYPDSRRKTIDWDGWDTSESTFKRIFGECTGEIKQDGKKRFPWDGLGTGESAFRALDEHFTKIAEVN